VSVPEGSGRNGPVERDSASFRSEALELSTAVDGAARLDRTGLWFVFQDNRLLVWGNGDEASVPEAFSLEALGVPCHRRQYVGTLSGQACYTAETEGDVEAPEGMSFHHLRKLWGVLPERIFWAAGTAFQVLDWDRTHQFCGRCGAATAVKTGERAKLCPRCDLVFYPRISPAVIVAVVHGDKILLARAHRFPVAMHSVIAGFVNPGESLEECVHREVAEETGIRVRKVRYFGSQPWPFPNSLMVGFTAEYAGGQLAPDQTELVSADWFTAADMPRIPDRPSIARRLIEWFLGGCRG
jgi:NAD+ diphosphatase